MSGWYLCLSLSICHVLAFYLPSYQHMAHAHPTTAGFPTIHALRWGVTWVILSPTGIPPPVCGVCVVGKKEELFAAAARPHTHIPCLVPFIPRRKNLKALAPTLALCVRLQEGVGASLFFPP